MLDRMTEPDSNSKSGDSGVAVAVLTLLCSDTNPQQLLDLYVMLKNSERSIQFNRKFLPCFYRVIVRCCTCAELNPGLRQVFMSALLSHCNLQWALEQLYLQRGADYPEVRAVLKDVLSISCTAGGLVHPALEEQCAAFRVRSVQKLLTISQLPQWTSGLSFEYTFYTLTWIHHCLDVGESRMQLQRRRQQQQQQAAAAAAAAAVATTAAVAGEHTTVDSKADSDKGGGKGEGGVPTVPAAEEGEERRAQEQKVVEMPVPLAPEIERFYASNGPIIVTYSLINSRHHTVQRELVLVVGLCVKILFAAISMAEFSSITEPVAKLRDDDRFPGVSRSDFSPGICILTFFSCCTLPQEQVVNLLQQIANVDAANQLLSQTCITKITELISYSRSKTR
jgi:hypothetical protein